jgi:hypothetical protein
MEGAFVGACALDLHTHFAHFLAPHGGKLPCPACKRFCLLSKGPYERVRRAYTLQGPCQVVSWEYRCVACAKGE